MAKLGGTPLAQAKKRTFRLLGGLVLAAGVVGVILLTSRREQSLQETTVTKIPGQISSIPGGKTSEKYRELQEEENKRRVSEARHTGASAIPTITGVSSQEAKESFGIEDELAKYKCPGARPQIDPAQAARLIAQIQANPADAAKLLAENPGLARALATQDPELLKKLLLENPELAKKLAKEDPELLKQLMQSDPAFARALAKNNPDLVKSLMKSDPLFAKIMTKQNPALVQALMDQDPAFAQALLSKNPDLAKDLKTVQLTDEKAASLMAELEANPALAEKLLRENPGLAKLLAQKNPALLKKLLAANPELAKYLAKEEPALLRELMQKDPELAKMVTEQMKTDPELTKLMAQNNPTLLKELMEKDPELAKTVTQQMKNDPALTKIIAQNNPALLKSLMEKDPELAQAVIQQMKNDPVLTKIIAQNNPALLKALMEKDPTLAQAVMQQMKNDPELTNIIADNNPALLKKLMQNPEFAAAILKQNPTIFQKLKATSASDDGSSPMQKMENKRKNQIVTKAEEARRLQLSEAMQKQLAALSAAMEIQSKPMFQAWSEVTAQQLVQGDWAKKEDSATTKGASGSAAGDAATTDGPMVKAGTIFFATLDTSINTDEPGPIMATLVQGPYKGAKLIGSVSFSPQSTAEKVTLNFSTLVLPDAPKSLTIQAVAIDPDTARIALASDVDHHYLLRYGTMLASSLLTGYAKIIADTGTTTTTTQTQGLLGPSVQTVTAPPTGGTDSKTQSKKAIFSALGDLGTKIGTATSSFTSRPITIKVDSGTGIGLLFLKDVQISSTTTATAPSAAVTSTTQGGANTATGVTKTPAAPAGRINLPASATGITPPAATAQ